MNKTAVVAISPNISGNVGSCAVTSNSFQKTLFTVETVAVNSCTGEVVSQSVYFDSTWLFGVPIILIMIGIGGWVIKSLFE